MTDIDRRSFDPWAPAPQSSPDTLTGVVQPPPAAPDPAPSDDDGLDDMKKAELVAMADELGVDASGTKADIIARLRSL